MLSDSVSNQKSSFEHRIKSYCSIKLGFQLLFHARPTGGENFLIRHCGLVVAQCFRENILQCSSELSCVKLWQQESKLNSAAWWSVTAARSISLRRKFCSPSIYMHWCIVTVALLLAFEGSSQAVWEPQPASRFVWRWTWSTFIWDTLGEEIFWLIFRYSSLQW
jgi:hypothetical protein